MFTTPFSMSRWVVVSEPQRTKNASSEVWPANAPK
jgi:hypothetical protein